MLLKELREQVFETALRMVADGVAHGAQGNISALHRDSDLIAITPSAVPYAVMKVEDICVIDRYGQVVEGRWKPTSEMPMHTIFYRERSDVGAVVHSHAPYATTFALIDVPLPVVLIESATCLGEPVLVAPYRRPGTAAIGRIALDTMGAGVAVLLAQHGLLTVGSNLDQAYGATLAAETTARLVIMARSMGREPISLDPSEVAFMHDLYLHQYHPTRPTMVVASALQPVMG